MGLLTARYKIINLNLIRLVQTNQSLSLKAMYQTISISLSLVLYHNAFLIKTASSEGLRSPDISQIECLRGGRQKSLI